MSTTRDTRDRESKVRRILPALGPIVLDPTLPVVLTDQCLARIILAPIAREARRTPAAHSHRESLTTSSMQLTGRAHRCRE